MTNINLEICNIYSNTYTLAHWVLLKLAQRPSSDTCVTGYKKLMSVTKSIFLSNL